MGLSCKQRTVRLDFSPRPATETGLVPIAGGAPVTVTVSQAQEDIVSVEVRGEVDLATAEQLKDGLDQACSLGKPILLSLEHTTYLDGRGIRVIERAEGRLRSSGQGFVLVGSLPIIHKLLKLCFGDEIHIVHTVDEGLAYLRRGLPMYPDGRDSGGSA